jgi:hypothetical protein
VDTREILREQALTTRRRGAAEPGAGAVALSSQGGDGGAQPFRVFERSG